MTLPVTPIAAVVGKFLAAWAFAGTALFLTIPVWITVNVLGSPDNGAIVAAYIGSFLMAGGFLAIGSCVSALTRSQVIAFVLSTVICFGFLLAGFPVIQGVFSSWAPPIVPRTIAGFSFLTRFDSISRGVISPRDLIFFLSLIGVLLMANAMIVDVKKAD